MTLQEQLEQAKTHYWAAEEATYKADAVSRSANLVLQQCGHKLDSASKKWYEGVKNVEKAAAELTQSQKDIDDATPPFIQARNEMHKAEGARRQAVWEFSQAREELERIKKLIEEAS
jgi:exonuclease VII small subunit